jgi:hypothetical protein
MDLIKPFNSFELNYYLVCDEQVNAVTTIEGYSSILYVKKPECLARKSGDEWPWAF